MDAFGCPLDLTVSSNLHLYLRLLLVTSVTRDAGQRALTILRKSVATNHWERLYTRLRVPAQAGVAVRNLPGSE